MNWKYLGCILIGVIIGFSVQKINVTKKFSPTAATCGTAVTPTHFIPDTFDRAVQCIKSGYKNIYWGDIIGIVYEQMPELYEKRQIEIINLENGSFILYTKKGEKNAHLLEKWITQKAGRNHYLTGTLLEYPEKDINFFYDRNKIEGFEKDKQNALEWITKHSHTAIKSRLVGS